MVLHLERLLIQKYLYNRFAPDKTFVTSVIKYRLSLVNYYHTYRRIFFFYLTRIVLFSLSVQGLYETSLILPVRRRNIGSGRLFMSRHYLSRTVWCSPLLFSPTLDDGQSALESFNGLEVPGVTQLVILP